MNKFCLYTILYVRVTVHVLSSPFNLHNKFITRDLSFLFVVNKGMLNDFHMMRFFTSFSITFIFSFLLFSFYYYVIVRQFSSDLILYHFSGKINTQSDGKKEIVKKL